MERIESMAGIKLERVPIPSEEDMQKAKNKDQQKDLDDLEEVKNGNELLHRDNSNLQIKAKEQEEKISEQNLKNR